jgi:hypothetical protein
MEISCTSQVKNEGLLHRHKVEWNIVHTIKRRKANRIGQILRRTRLLNRLLREDEEGDVGSHWMTLRGKKEYRILKYVGNTAFHSVKYSLWKRVWICCKTLYNEFIIMTCKFTKA